MNTKLNPKLNPKLNCPVCGYKEIEGKICPNCDTDLSLIRTLQELEPVNKTAPIKKISNWTFAVAILMLIIGIWLGAIGSFVLIKNQYITNTTFSSNSAVVSNSEALTNTANANLYSVQPGDNLGVIAEKVCGRASAWKLIAQANPHLENRRNYFINVGEKLKIPNCQEQNP
jgi:LysM repeat protein